MDKRYTIITNVIHIINSRNPTQAIINSIRIVEPDGNLIEPTDEQKWAMIRAVRNSLLRQTDWIQVKFAEIGNANPVSPDLINIITQWEVYRQKLRDIPQDYDKPESVEWPDEPEQLPNPTNPEYPIPPIPPIIPGSKPKPLKE